MKKLSLLLIAAFAASLAIAQGPGGRPGGPGGPGGAGGPGGPGGPGGRRGMDPKAQLEALKKTLNLTPAQIKKVEAAQAERKASMDKLRAAPGDRKSKGPEMKKIRDAFDGKLHKILTKEQSAKFDKMQAEMRAKWGGRGPGGPGGAGGPGGGRGGRPGGPSGPGGGA